MNAEDPTRVSSEGPGADHTGEMAAKIPPSGANMQPGELGPHAATDVPEVLSEVESAIQDALDAYEAALLDWSRRDTEVTAGLAEVPWELSRGEFIKHEALMEAQKVIDRRYPVDEATSNAEAYAYTQEIRRLEMAIKVVEGSLPWWRGGATGSESATPDGAELDRPPDIGPGMDIDL